jgi:hypothetical protein
MGQLIGFGPFVLILCALAAAPRASESLSRAASASSPAARESDSAVAPMPAAKTPSGRSDLAKKRPQRTGPLKKLIFSARDGFAMRMISSQEVTAEIRNGAGRTLARGDFTLEAGDWILRPRNMAPGLYTVHLRNGRQLRAVKMKIEDPVRGHGVPEWVLEKAAPGFDSLQAPGPFPEVPRRGASAVP